MYILIFEELLMRQEYQSVPNVTPPSGEHTENYKRKLNPSDIKLPLGYNITLIYSHKD
jgi:hypothetical protein